MIALYVDLEAQWRGGQSQALLTLRGLRARGHGAELLAVRGGALARRAAAEGIPVHTVGRQARQVQAALRLRGLLARQTFDLVHANEPHALTAAWLARAHRRLPVVVSRRVVYPLRNHAWALARYRAARCVVAVSRFVAERLKASGLPADQVEIIYDGVEVPQELPPAGRHLARQRWGIGESEVLLGYVGHLSPEKGHELLIRALPGLRAKFPACRLLLAGEGPCRVRLERLVREWKLESAVQFAGFVEDVPQVYAALDVFVFPSLADALGTSLLAAMSHALPVVAVARGGVTECIEDGRSGLLVFGSDPADYPQGIVQRVARLLGDRDFAKGLGRAARDTIAQRFTADHMVERTLRCYERLRAPAAPD